MTQNPQSAIRNPQSNRRPVRRTLLLLLLLLSGVDGVVRVAIEPWVYADKAASPSVLWRVALYHETPPPDVLIMGSSRVQLGLSPVLMAQTLAQAGLSPARILNLGLKLGTTQSNLWLLKNVIQADKQPKVIIYGAAEYEFNANIGLPHDYDYTNELATLRDYGQAFPDPSRRIDAQLGFLLGRASYLVRYHQAIRDQLEASDAPPATTNAAGLPPDPYGFVPSELIMNAGTIGRMRGEYVDAPGWGLLRDYQVGGQGVARFEEFLHLAQARGIRVILVNMPIARVHETFLSPAAYASYRAYLQATATRYGLAYYDYNRHELWPEPQDWQDTNHLNSWGAAKFSPLLAREALVPALRDLAQGRRP
ncbi:MAG: hypothetical protein M3Z04_18665 [Chloroflexota bacterium]|nr:hypothetical protein [Chloroflexota bacterium]